MGDDPLDLVGRTVGASRIDRVDADRGSSVTYRATDAAIAVDAIVAPKRVGAEGVDRAKRILRDVTADAGVARAIDAGEHEGERGVVFWIAREVVEGKTLEADLAARSSGRAPLEAIAILSPVARALDRAHARKVAHLALAPSRIVLPSRADRSPKVIDFTAAVAKIVHGRPAMGEGAYAAPEQIDPTLGEAGPWSDVFALALVFMEVVVGARILSGDAESIHRRRFDRAVRPSFRDHGLAFARPVEEVLARALAVDPDARPQSAGAFWDALVDATRTAPSPFPTPLVEAPPAEERVSAPTASTVARSTKEVAGFGVAIAIGVLVFVAELALRDRTPSAPSAAASSIATATSTVAPSAPIATPHVVAAASSSVAPPPPIPPEMIVVKARGARFAIDRTEVTVAAYRACVKAGACTDTPEHGFGYVSGDPLRGGYVCNLHVEGRDRHPVNCVTWRQANTYCGFAKKRLPTESEFEIAARGDTQRRYPWGDDPPTCTRVVFARYGPEKWGCKDEPVGTAEVDAHPAAASPLGVLDLAGNLWEWTATRKDGGLGVLRGGGWDSSESGVAIESSVEQAVYNGDVDMGFRCARDLSEQD